MDALEYFKIKKRMTKNCGIDCDECLLGCNKNSRGISCSGLEIDYPNEAIKIVKEWEREQ